MGGILRRALEDQRSAFRDKFGHDPEPNDPIFFDPNADEPRPIQEEDFVAATIRAMTAAGMHPAKIYAFEKTGMLVTQDNVANWSREDLNEWNAAIHEYELKSRDS